MYYTLDIQFRPTSGDLNHAKVQENVCTPQILAENVSVSGKEGNILRKFDRWIDEDPSSWNNNPAILVFISYPVYFVVLAESRCS